MAVLTWVLLSLAVLLVVLVLRQPQRKGLPPGPRGLPLVGSLFDLISQNSPQYFASVSQKYGPLASLQLGLQRVVLINSQEWLQQAFVRQGEHFNHRPHGTVIYFVTNGRGIAMAEDQKWKDSRQLTVQVLKDFGVGKNSIENYINLEVQALLETMQNKVNQPYNMHHDLSTSVLNIVWHMLVGERFKMGDSTLQWIINTLEQSLNLMEAGGFLNFTPLLQFVGTFLRPSAFKVLFSMIHRMRYFKRLINDHSKNLDDPNKSHDLIYAFLEEKNRLLRQGEPLGTFTDSQLSWLLSDLFIVGLDTTVTTMRWAVLFLVTRPWVASRVQAEIDSVIGRERVPCLADSSCMPYMEAFVNEVLRFSSVTPLAVHAVSQDTTLGDYYIPRQTVVIANIWGIHHDPKVWGDPNNFRPERFLDHDGNVMKSEHMVAFSLGRRNCLGEALARSEIFLFLCSMLQKFTFSATGSLPCEEPQPGILLHPKPYKVIISLH